MHFHPFLGYRHGEAFSCFSAWKAWQLLGTNQLQLDQGAEGQLEPGLHRGCLVIVCFQDIMGIRMHHVYAIVYGRNFYVLAFDGFDSGSGMCLTLSPSPLVDVAQGQSAHATSSIDAFHSAQQEVDGTSSSYWAADPEDQEKIFWISFPQTRLGALWGDFW